MKVQLLPEQLLHAMDLGITIQKKSHEMRSNHFYKRVAGGNQEQVLHPNRNNPGVASSSVSKLIERNCKVWDCLHMCCWLRAELSCVQLGLWTCLEMRWEGC